MPEVVRKATKSRTMRFAAIVAVLGALQTNLPMLQEYIPERAYGIVMLLIAVGIAWARVITTQPLSEK